MTASGTGVCINGAVRTFVYPIVHLSIKRTLLPALEDPVVFASLTLQEIHNADVAYNSRRWTVPVTREALQAALVAVAQLHRAIALSSEMLTSRRRNLWPTSRTRLA